MNMTLISFVLYYGIFVYTIWDGWIIDRWRIIGILSVWPGFILNSATTWYVGGSGLLHVGALCVGGLIHVFGSGVGGLVHVFGGGVGGGALGERSGLVGVAGLVHVGWGGLAHSASSGDIVVAARSSNVGVSLTTGHIGGVGGVWGFNFASAFCSDVLGTLSNNVFFSFGVVDDLSLNRQILNSFPDSFHWFIFHNGLFYFFGNVFHLSFDSVVIGDGSFHWDSLAMDYFFIFDDLAFVGYSVDTFYLVVLDVFFLEWDVFDPTFNWDFFCNHFLSNVRSGYIASIHHLRAGGLVGSSLVGSYWLGANVGAALDLGSICVAYCLSRSVFGGIHRLRAYLVWTRICFIYW